MTTLSLEDRRLITREFKYRDRGDRLTRTGIPQRFWNWSWDDFHVTDGNTTMLSKLRTYAEEFQNAPVMHGGRGILLQGVPGVGKTMALGVLGVTLSDDGYFVRYLPTAKFVRLHQELIGWQQAWDKHDDQDAYVNWVNQKEFLRHLREVAHLVILDDVGKEHHTGSGYTIALIDEFIRERYDLGRPVAMTTNLAITEWGLKYSASMESFLREACAIRETVS